MNKFNPCLTGNSKVLTIDGPVSFSELAVSGDDVLVYCIDDKGEIRLSKMFHPRVTGFNREIMKITLEDGTVIESTPNHEFLTDAGYVAAEDLFEDDNILFTRLSEEFSKSGVDSDIAEYCNVTGTKKGTVVKKCEMCGNEFECVWEERELCAEEEHQRELYYDVIEPMKNRISEKTKDWKYLKIDKIEFQVDGEDVYNGTVAVYHNYFTIDESTGTIINHMNCGE